LWASVIEALKSILQGFYGVTGSYGLAIVLLTLLFHVVLLPVTIAQNRSMRKMQEIQPEINKLQKKYEKDKTRLNQEMMKLWKENNVNPMGGCLPMLVQFPIMIAIFYTLRDFDFAGQGIFLWIPDLAMPDPLRILPILAGVTTFLHSKFSMPASAAAGGTQATMVYVMPVFIAVISMGFPSGLAIYWVVSNIFRLAQHYLIDLPGLNRERTNTAGEK